MPALGTILSGSQVAQAVRLASDFAVSGNNAYTSVTNFQFPVTSGTLVCFWAIIPFTSAATTTGVRFSLTGPTLTRGAWDVEIPPTTGTAPYAPTRLTQTAYDTGTVTASVPTTDNLLCVMEGFVQCSASGNVIVRVANEVNNSAITVKAGALLVYG